MPVSGIFPQWFSRFMKEPLLLKQEVDPEEAIEGTVTAIMTGQLGNSPTLTYILNAKGHLPFFGEEVVSNVVRENSIYDGLIEFQDESIGTVITPREMARILRLEDHLQEVIDLYVGSASYVSYFDVVLITRAEIYRYLVNRNRFLYLASSQVIPCGLCAIVPVVNVIRGLLVRGEAGYQTGLAHAGCFVGQVHRLALDWGIESRITSSDLFERALGINDNYFFSAPVSITWVMGEGVNQVHSNALLRGRSEDVW